MKQIIEIIDFTGLISFVYAGAIGIAAQLGIADINPAVYITAVGGFIWIIVKSVMMFKKHELEVKREASDLKKKEQEWQMVEFEIQKRKAEVRQMEISRLMRGTTVHLEEEEYLKMYENENRYIKEMQQLLDKQKKKAK